MVGGAVRTHLRGIRNHARLLKHGDGSGSGAVEAPLQPVVDKVPEGPCPLEVEEPLQPEMEVYEGPLQLGAVEEPCGETEVPAPVEPARSGCEVEARTAPEQRMLVQPPESRGSRLCLQGRAGLSGGRPPDQRRCHHWRCGRPPEETHSPVVRRGRWCRADAPPWHPQSHPPVKTWGLMGWWRIVLWCDVRLPACELQLARIKMAQSNNPWSRRALFTPHSSMENYTAKGAQPDTSKA